MGHEHLRWGRRLLLFHINHIGLAIISGCLVIENRVDGHTEVWLAGARIEILKHAEVLAEVLPTGRSPTQGYSGGGDPKNTVLDRIKGPSHPGHYRN